MRILVVEDEPDLLEAIAEGLRINGYAVDMCDNGVDAYELAFVENYDLVILDLNLPKMNGINVLEKIRQEKPELKIVILSARSSVKDKVTGLDLGANDYLTKPFAFEELEARIRNLMRRKFIQENTILSCGKLKLDLSKRTAFIGKNELVLTRKEFGLLEYLLLHKDRVISQCELIEHIWDSNADCFNSSIRVHIASLRKKLKAFSNHDPIQTKIGEGYFVCEVGLETGYKKNVI